MSTDGAAIENLLHASDQDILLHMLRHSTYYYSTNVYYLTNMYYCIYIYILVHHVYYQTIYTASNDPILDPIWW